MASAIEQSGFPIVQITAVPSVSRMVGVSRILQGESIVNVLGDAKLSKEAEKDLRRKYVLRALEILRTDIEDKRIFTLRGKY